MGMGVSTVHYEDLSNIKNEVTLIVRELLEVAKLEEGDVLVVGCSSSEVASHSIGSFSSEEIGKAIFETIQKELEGTGVYLAAQCCEHLNRALIVEKEYAKQNQIPIVSVVPKLKAGGSFATAAFCGMNQPVAIEHIKAHAGIDIGDTFIGMHLSEVAVPVRLKQNTIGKAHITAARTRPKYIGGSRAMYE